MLPPKGINSSHCESSTFSSDRSSNLTESISVLVSATLEQLGNTQCSPAAIPSALNLTQLTRIFPSSTSPTPSSSRPASSASASSTANVGTSVQLSTNVTNITPALSSFSAYQSSGVFHTRRSRDKGIMPAAERASKRPIAPKGSNFPWSLNSHINRTPVRLGVREHEKLSIEVRDDKNRRYVYNHASRQPEEWGNARWVSSVNKWRQQIFRRLFSHDPASHTPHSIRRAPWDCQQVNTLKDNIKALISETKRPLNKSDWKALAAKQNQTYEGKYIPKGTNLVQTSVTDRKGITKTSIAAPLANSSKISARTGSGLSAIVRKLPDVRKLITDHLATVVAHGSQLGTTSPIFEVFDIEEDVTMKDAESQEEEEQDIESESKKSKRRDIHGGILDHHLEDQSDDDEGGGDQPFTNRSFTGFLTVEAHG